MTDATAAQDYPTACPKNTQWYRCSNGFAGCCSVDVCTSGSCPDKPQDPEDSSSSSSAAKSSSTRQSSSSTTSTLATSTSSVMSSDDSTSSPASATTTSQAFISKASPSSTPKPTSSPSPPSSSSTPPTSSSPSRMSDSGVTTTISNDSTVTVTRHTTITQELPSTTTDPTASSTINATQDTITSSSFETPSPIAPSATAPAKQPSSGINTGIVVGIAVGGAFAVALIAVLIWVWRSRRRRNREVKEVERENGNESLLVDKARLHESIFGRRPSRRRGSTTLPKHPTPHQASGQGYGYDPFAPFGGRTDRPARTSPPPPPNTFEMDGRGLQVIELPDTAVTTGHAVAVDGSQRQETRSARAVKHHPSHDPRATLNHLPPRENGRPTYINQWNQFKGLVRETDSK
ncbi:hypothetical protein LMH87_007225 [Akanthomyces muscarius]|uniref:Uncharacterized protein n=1 Tax=Akanthomyces muscarius TaxID=2231603 RepID=A0A9W8QP98_AKAMU|nr:hypothetical protein LMH87_007225 [Akanthomyces muscarius]KAJ4165601.1 hypothetical protein LMH87_007225 [Akanthomyces muscarius]